MLGEDLSPGSTRILFVVLGAILIFAGFRAVRESVGIVRHDSVASGFVSRLNAGGSHPQIQFRTGSGEIVSYPQGGMVFGYRKGEAVKVLYDPREPSAGPIVKAFWPLWGGALECGLFGTASLFYGATRLFAKFPVGLYWRGR